MKAFSIQPTGTGPWLSPKEVVSRLAGTFDRFKADAEAGRSFGENFVNKYRQLLAVGLGDESSIPLEVVERQWCEAVLVTAADDSEETAPFYAYVQTEHPLELRFGGDTSYEQQRRSADKVALALGYSVEEVDPDE